MGRDCPDGGWRGGRDWIAPRLTRAADQAELRRLLTPRQLVHSVVLAEEDHRLIMEAQSHANLCQLYLLEDPYNFFRSDASLALKAFRFSRRQVVHTGVCTTSLVS